MNVRKALQMLGAVAIVTLVALKVILRIVDLRELHEGVSEGPQALRVAGSPSPMAGCFA
jgi:hypothetical protein